MLNTQCFHGTAQQLSGKTTSNLVSARKAAFSGSRQHLVAAKGLSCARGASFSGSRLIVSMGIGFHVGEEPGDFEPKELVVPSNAYGLSPGQLQTLGLDRTESSRIIQPSAELVSAKYNYRKEVPSMRAYETQMSGGGVPAQAPPDLPSLLLNSRICYLGMPLVPAVTELIIAELLFLGYDNAEKPIYFYINSTGSQTPEGESVGFETEAYAMIDTMRYVKPEIHTVCVGKAWGNAAMLLASGKKGARHSLPHASIMTCPPRINRAQDCVKNIAIKARELDDNTETYVDFLQEFTGKDREEVHKDVGRKRWFTPEKAMEYGLIDKIVDKGLEMEKKDYETMLQMAQARAQGYSPAAPAGGAAGM